MFNWRAIFKPHSRGGKTQRNSYLDNRGWYLSLEQRKALGLDSHSSPLLPYSLADLIDERLKHEMNVYVRWDMHSYRWLLHRVHHVSSAHIAMRRIGKSRRGRFERVDELSREQVQDYVDAHKEKFDFILFDGPGKLDTVETILAALKPDGVIALVDDRLDAYDMSEVGRILAEKGFKRLAFRNPAPLFHELDAALFYRAENCFQI